MPKKHKNRKQNKITELKRYIIITIINVNEINLLKENTQIDQTNGISLQKPHLTPEMDKTQCW